MTLPRAVAAASAGRTVVVGDASGRIASPG
jgi:hypothetical protein